MLEESQDSQIIDLFIHFSQPKLTEPPPLHHHSSNQNDCKNGKLSQTGFLVLNYATKRDIFFCFCKKNIFWVLSVPKKINCGRSLSCFSSLVQPHAREFGRNGWSTRGICRSCGAWCGIEESNVHHWLIEREEKEKGHFY